MILNIHEHKRYYYTFDNSLLFTESIQNTTNLSTLNRNVRFLPCQHRGVGIMQYVYALNLFYHLIFQDTLKVPIRIVVMINQDIQWQLLF